MSTQSAPAQATLPRLLTGIRPGGAISFDEHRQIHGPVPLGGAAARGESLFAAIERSGLTGRGGAAFPTGRKMRALLDARARRQSGSMFRGAGARPIVIVNATEGEPASFKDKLLLEALPHLVIDGAVLAAQAIGARQAIICLCAEAGHADEALARALTERSLRADAGIQLQMASAPMGYVSGQETALISFLNGGAAKPTFTPPLPFESGVQGRPTLLDNAETVAQIALIARYGADWFRQLGEHAQPGSALVTLVGAVNAPGVFEIEYGSRLDALLAAADGLAEPIRAALIGGYGGAWIDQRHLPGLALSNAGLAAAGGRFGCGVIALLGESRCGVAESSRLVRWLADQSAGQCGPCSKGLPALAETVEALRTGNAGGEAIDRLQQLGASVRGRGACAHPDGAANLIASTLAVFGEELEDHARHGPCARCHAEPALALPEPTRATRPPAEPADRASDAARGQRRRTVGDLGGAGRESAFSERSDRAARRRARQPQEARS